MMKLCSITNAKNAEWMFKYSKKVMLLTHLVEKDENYVKTALNHPNTYKILDNSLIELAGALNMDRLVAAAEKINADEIILPDVFREGGETVKSAIESIKWLKEHNKLGEYKLMAVCHGKTEEEFTKCFNELNSMKEIDVIGIPKVMSSMPWVANRNRASLFNIFKNTKKKIHFLGSWYQLGELLEMPKEVYKFVRSCDTCLPFLDCVQHKGIFEDRDGTIDLEKDYPEVTEEQYSNFIKNLNKEFKKAYSNKNIKNKTRSIYKGQNYQGWKVFKLDYNDTERTYTLGKRIDRNGKIVKSITVDAATMKALDHLEITARYIYKNKKLKEKMYKSLARYKKFKLPRLIVKESKKEIKQGE